MTKRPLPPLEPYKLAWIFDRAREHFSAEVRCMLDDVARYERHPKDAPVAEAHWVDRRKSSEELKESKLARIEKLLAVIEFCDVARERCEDASAKEFANAMGRFFDSKTKPGR